MTFSKVKLGLGVLALLVIGARFADSIRKAPIVGGLATPTTK